MLRDEIAPALRRAGFTGSGTQYRLPDPDVFRLLGFQKDKWSTAEEVGFTTNLQVIAKVDWEQFEGLASVPTANMISGVGRWERLVELMPDPPLDRWWRMRAGEPTADLAAEVVAAVVDHGVPSLRRSPDPVVDEQAALRGRALRRRRQKRR